jgi:hypothetical protein
MVFVTIHCSLGLEFVLDGFFICGLRAMRLLSFAKYEDLTLRSFR